MRASRACAARCRSCATARRATTPWPSTRTAPRLPAGSLLLTGTPAGVALATPDPLGLVARGALRLRSPFEQFRQEELARAAAREPGGYLAPGDRVRARIAGLGTQIIRIAEPGAPVPDLCRGIAIAPDR